MFTTTWTAPSNIAFIKYWGKKGPQLPANPSLSMSLQECVTKTQLEVTEHDEFTVEVLFNEKPSEVLTKKLFDYIKSIPDLDISKKKFKITTSNTFPHGTGIASSASGMAALALCLAEYHKSLSASEFDIEFFKEASSWARLGSGSACRSVFGGFNTWGECGESDRSDLFATPLSVHPSFKKLKDSILVIDDQEKKVSSTAGHGEMKNHLFSAARFESAKKHFSRMVSALKSGDMEEVGTLLEKEALELHGMMMTSPHPYILLKPNTLAAIELVQDFRIQTKIPLFFTLDAGPNLHLIYLDTHTSKVETFIQHELLPLAKKVIHDVCGEGPRKC